MNKKNNKNKWIMVQNLKKSIYKKDSKSAYIKRDIVILIIKDFICPLKKYIKVCKYHYNGVCTKTKNRYQHRVKDE